MTKYYAYTRNAKTCTTYALMSLDVHSFDEAYDALNPLTPCGEYETLFVAEVDGDTAYAAWMDESGWMFSKKSSDSILAEIEQAANAAPLAYGELVNSSLAANMLHVSKARVAQLIANGQLDVVEVGGTKLIAKASVLDRVGSVKVGRPREYKVVSNLGTDSDYDAAIYRGKKLVGEIGYSDITDCVSYYYIANDGTRVEEHYADSGTSPRDVIQMIESSK